MVAFARATIPQKEAKVEYNRRTVLLLHCHNLPAVGALVLDTGVKRDLVVGSSGGAAGVCLTDLFHAGYTVSSGAQLGGEGDGIAGVQLMNVAKIAVCSSIVVE